MRRKTVFKLAACQLFTFLYCFVLVSAHAALDAPHNGDKGIGCLSCHQMTSTYPKLLPPLYHIPLPGDLDDTVANGLCWSCHNDSMPPQCGECHTSSSAPLVLTHSSLTTSPGYGNWTVECWVCHNQHTQEQQFNGSTYGKYIRRSINLANIKGADGNTFVDGNNVKKEGTKSVIFKGATGAKSFADDTAPADGICQVCHANTGHWGASSSTPAGDKHFSAWACTECHDHTNGFKAGWPDHDQVIQRPPFCTSCHASSVFDLHPPSESTPTCKRCHQTNNNYEFTGTLPTVYLEGRLTKHIGKDKLVFPGTAPARCDDCHHGQFTEHVTDTGHNKLHDKVVLGYDSDNNGSGDQVLACDSCHFPDAIQEHVTQRNFTCSVCHDRTGLGLTEVAAITGTIATGMGGTPVFCDDCHNDDHFLTDPGTSLVKEHHHTPYSNAGECSKCHVVGPGERGPHRPPCWYCHATGKPGDPQRAGVNRHDRGPAITADSVKDFRVCFSCHLEGGQGYVAGVTPLATPMHGLPGTAPNYSNVYWPFGYYRDASNQWVASDPLIPTDTNGTIPDIEEYPDKWLNYPGFHTLNYLGEKKNVHSTVYNDSTHPEVQNWARFGTNSIRNTVGNDYMNQGYPTVPIRNGGNFAVPSFDGTGTIGKPTGSGSVSVTLNPATALVAGAQWRLDGGPWQNSGTTFSPVTDRGNHLLEFKPVAGLDEPPPIQVTVANAQTSTFEGTNTTYTTCPGDPSLQVQRSSGDTNPSFAWTRPEQEEIFGVTGWNSGPVECEVWRKIGDDQVKAEGFAVAPVAGSDSCRLFKDGASPPGDYDLILKVAGSSCFRNSAELLLSVTVTAAGAPSPFGQAGGKITQPFLNSLALPTTSYEDFLHLAGDLYVHLNGNGVISTFSIDNSGNISPVLATTDLWGGNTTGTDTKVKMVRVSDTLMAVSYNLRIWVSSTSSYVYESHIMTLGIEQNGSVINKKQDYNFHTDIYSLRPLIFPHHDNKNLFMVTWVTYGNGSPYTTTTGLLTVNIYPSGVITELAREMTLPNKGLNWEGTIVHVAGDKYAYAMAQDIKFFQVSATGAITIPNTPDSIYQYDTNASYVDMIRVKGDIFALAYPNSRGGGILKTISINDSGAVSPTINSYLFEPRISFLPHLLPITDNVIGVYYPQPGLNLKTIAITDDGRIMVPQLDGVSFSGGGSGAKLLQVGKDIFAFLLNQDTSSGVSFSGVKTYSISRDSDRDGLADSADNCPAQANAGQADSDGDGSGDACDVCSGFDDMVDADGDGIADPCDICPGHDDAIDSDHDTMPDGCDPCPGDPDNDADNDGICAGNGYNAPMAGDNDNCPLVANGPTEALIPNVGNQTDSDCDGAGDACGAPVYFSPGSATVQGLTPKWLTIAWNDAMNGEDGYRIEGKQGACNDNTYAYGPLATVYRYDRFDTGLDLTGWVPGVIVKTTSSAAFPASATDASGTAEVSWENGKIKLHSVMNDLGEAGAYNSAYISVNKFAQIIGDRDFDLQVDYELPDGPFSGDQYHVDVRLGFYFPDTDGKHNEAFIERLANQYTAYFSVNGVAEYGVISTVDASGTLRLVRKNRELAAYILNGNDWVLVKKHSHPQTADLAPSWMGIVQYAQRNESGGGELTALVDNFRFNTVGSVPVATLNLPLNEASWSGSSGEVKDVTTGNNHGSARNGVTTVADAERGRVGHFNGSTSYVEVPGNGSLENVTDKSFTFAAWAKPANVPPATDNVNYTDHNYAIIARNGYHTELRYSSVKQFAFDTWNADATPQPFMATSTSTYEPGSWYHVAGVLDLSTNKVSLYVNGTLAGTPVDFVGTPREYGTTPYYIGMGRIDIGSTFYFNGEMSDVQVFDRALTAKEVGALYNNRIEFTAKGLSADTTYCARIYPFITNGCSDWTNHGVQAEGRTMTSLAAQATTAGTASAAVIRGANTLYVNMPYLNDNDGDNSYTVEYKLSSTTTWTSHTAGAAHVASPYVTKISGLTPLAKYDVRVTYADPDGVSGTAQQLLQGITISPAISCLAILNAGGSAGDGVYWIDPDGDGPTAPYQAYCDMTADGGGWTLAMKLDGSQTTFQYSASYWTTANTLNPGSLSFDTVQAKLQSFNDVAFTQVRLGMRQYTNPADDIDWITVNQSAGSLVSLFNSGFIATGVGRANWLNLLEGVNTQDFCNKEGFNAEQSYSKMRIGLAMNQENDCYTCDRILGFGNAPTGHPWGAWAVVGGGYPGANTLAYGWIMVR